MLPHRQPAHHHSSTLPPLPPPPPTSSPPDDPHHTSLPPLRHLYLAQPPLPPHHHHPHHQYPYSQYHHPPPQQTAHPPLDPEESEPDDVELHGPPKKKRRRQALSCTECKRRKIKCDRNQPCAPCTRRGEQAKCQWHVVEPIEKYVTRSEYDELKERVDHLSLLVNRLLNHAQTPTANLGAPSEAVSPYVSGLSYHPLMPPPQNYPQQPSTSTDPSTLQAPTQSHRYSKPDEPTRPSHPVRASSVALSPSSSSSLLTTRPPPKSPTTAAALPKSSPLSLAAITSPFTPSDHAAQSKNYHAQTFILGERLRPGSHPLKGPVIPTVPIPPKVIPIGILPSISTHLRPANGNSAI